MDELIVIKIIQSRLANINLSIYTQIIQADLEIERVMASQAAVVQCVQALTIANAADLHTKLKEAVESSSDIELVADGVDKVDTAGLQLMVALSREIEKVNGTLVWKNPSEVLVQAVNTLGLRPYLAINPSAG